jgi:general secretion pathway protein L
MSLLVIQLPARPRLGARDGGEVVVPLPAPTELDYVLSADGQQLTLAGRASPATLPRAQSVVAVVDDADIAWHLIHVPKAPAARLRAALAGVMEEKLLEDEDQLHLALAADATPGQRGWVAVTHKAWLQTTLAALEAAGLEVERLLPASRPARPGEPALGHFAQPQGSYALATAAAADDQPRLVLARADGVLCTRLGGALARALLPAAETPVRWTATPAAAAAAEAWLGAPVTVQREAERLLAVGRSALAPGAGTDNLRQFDLVARRRGSRAVSAGFKRLLSPRWRPVRWGLVSLLVVQLLGLNAYAWQQQRALQDKRAAMVQLLRDTHPGVRAVLDAPLQMQRETERLRARAGRTGDADLEALLAAAAAAWPDGQGPVQTLRYEAGRLTLGAPGWNAGELAQFQQRLQGGGYAAQQSGSSITLSRVMVGGGGASGPAS